MNIKYRATIDYVDGGTQLSSDYSIDKVKAGNDILGFFNKWGELEHGAHFARVARIVEITEVDGNESETEIYNTVDGPFGIN